MGKVDIVRAWKDEEYRNSLSAAERTLLAEHPAGLIELDDEQMRSVLGGGGGGYQPTPTATTKYCG